MRGLTQRRVSKLRLPTEGSRIVWDGEIPGFGARLTAGGVSFVLAYRLRGRQTKYKIGRWPEMHADRARKEALRLRGEIAEGKDPQEQRQKERHELSVADLGRMYIEKHAERKLAPGTVRGYREILRDIIGPKIGRLPLSACAKRDVAAMHTWARDGRRVDGRKTPYRANRALALVSAMYNWAIEEEELCDRNPAMGIKQFPEDERDFFLADEQLAALDRAIDEYGRDCAEAIRLLILTGAREMEVLRALWSEFDLQRGWWTKPSHHTKEKKIEHRPLGDAALLVLRRMKEKATGACLFPGKSDLNIPRVTIRKPWRQICKAAGLVTEHKKQGKRKELVLYRPILRIHDLRHTYASWLVNRGVSLETIGKLLCHASRASTNRYAHLADAAIKAAADMIPRTWVN